MNVTITLNGQYASILPRMSELGYFVRGVNAVVKDILPTDDINKTLIKLVCFTDVQKAGEMFAEATKTRLNCVTII